MSVQYQGGSPGLRSLGLRLHLAPALAVLCIATMYSAAAYYVTNAALVPFQALHVYVLVCFLTVLIATVNQRAIDAIGQHFGMFVIVGVFLCILAIQTGMFPVGEAEAPWFESRVAFSIMLLVFLILFSACRSLNVVRGALFFVVLLSCAINLIEFFSGGELFGWLSTTPGRAAGFYENPNASALHICLAIPLLALQSSARSRIVLYAVTLLGVYVTFSRSGLILWAAALLITEMSAGNRQKSPALRATFLMLVAMLAIATLMQFSATLVDTVSSALTPYLDANTISRVGFVDNMSSNERLYVLQRGLEEFGNAPLFGNGTGFTRSWNERVSVHNIFVLVLAEYGLVGFGWLAAFLFVIGSYGSRMTAALLVMFCLSGVFTHNHFDRPTTALIIALYLVTAARSRLTRRVVPQQGV